MLNTAVRNGRPQLPPHTTLLLCFVLVGCGGRGKLYDAPLKPLATLATSSAIVSIVPATNRAIVTILDDDYRFTAIEVIFPHVLLNFTTVAGQTNRVEWTSVLATNGVWTEVPGAGSIVGNGTVLQVIDLNGATQPQRFYRVRRLP